VAAFIAPLIALLAEIALLLSRFFFLFKEIILVIVWNIRFIGKIFLFAPQFLKYIAMWGYEFIAILPGLLSAGMATGVGQVINAAIGTSCCGVMITNAVNGFSDVTASIPGLAYFAEPLRLGYGMGLIFCALWVRLFLKYGLPLALPRRLPLPGPKWPQLPGH
jgi:hypothetical protein